MSVQPTSPRSARLRVDRGRDVDDPFRTPDASRSNSPASLLRNPFERYQSSLSVSRDDVSLTHMAYRPPVASNNVYSHLLSPNSAASSSARLDRYPIRKPSGISTKSSSDEQDHALPFLDSPYNPSQVMSDKDDFPQYDFYATDLTSTLFEKEDDDWLHEPDDQDEKDRFTWASLYTKRGAANLGFLGFLLVGALVLFILVPALTFTGKIGQPAPSADYLGSASNFKILRTSMIDPATPSSARTKTSVFGKTYNLVFSDEFNTDGRTFYEGDDQFWTAPDFHYAATSDLEWYDPDAVEVANGTLRLRLDAFQNHNLNYRSGMLQSWNKLCFAGGMLDVSASLAGPGDVQGLWPGIWTLGNLGRPGYLATTDGTWPYSYNECDAGITPNQSSPDGLNYLSGQRLPSCTCPGADHPNAGVGRGAPEIDALEGTVGNYNPTEKVGIASQSLQTAPFDMFWHANYDFLAIQNESTTQMNSWTGGPYQQALSGITTLNTKWYKGYEYQNYGFDYIPTTSSNIGQVAWHVGDEWTWQMNGGAIGPNGNVGQRLIPGEPMSIVLNLGISTSWVYIDYPALEFPSTMYIDYVRIYQDPSNGELTCDPPGFPTTDYIKQHPAPYSNVNLTSWEDAGYSRPKNTLEGC